MTGIYSTIKRAAIVRDVNVLTNHTSSGAGTHSVACFLEYSSVHLDNTVEMQAHSTFQAHETVLSGVNSDGTCYACFNNIGLALDVTCQVP